MKLVPYSNIPGQGAAFVLWTARVLAYLALLGIAYCLFFFFVFLWQTFSPQEITLGMVVRTPVNSLLAPFIMAIPFVVLLLVSALFAALAKYLSNKNAVSAEG